MTAKNIVVCDRNGAIYENRENLNSIKIELAKITNQNHQKGSLLEVLTNSNVFIGLSGPNLLSKKDLEKMSKNAIIFGLSNPVPEFDPQDLPNNISVMATGRSDYPNQINNVLVFPGFFKGLFRAKITKVTDEMKLKAAMAISQMISNQDLTATNILPKALDRKVVDAVAKAVAGE